LPATAAAKITTQHDTREAGQMKMPGQARHFSSIKAVKIEREPTCPIVFMDTGVRERFPRSRLVRNTS
jgi:hypothetical protein